jgi:NADPH:quinone reductase-like Zn-dependent oxidoreductase
MKAAVYEAYGPPDVVEIREIAKPTPKAGEVLIKMRATSVTSGDARMRAFDIPPLFKIPGRFMLGWPKPKKPVLGFEFAGVVEAVGAAVTKFKPGDEVFGGHVGGAHAEYNCAPEGGAIALKPPNLSFEEAASVPFGGNTSLTFLHKAGVKPGQNVVIIGASGCVGSYAVQLARHMGAKVTAVCSGANAEFVRSLGATEIIDYTTHDVKASGKTFDVVFETVGSMNFAEAMPLVAPNGTFIAGVLAPADMWPMLWPPARHGRRIIGEEAKDSGDNIRELARLLTNGAIRPVIDSTFEFARIREAHARVDSKRKRGAVIVTV